MQISKSAAIPLGARAVGSSVTLADLVMIRITPSRDSDQIESYSAVTPGALHIPFGSTLSARNPTTKRVVNFYLSTPYCG
jgi:hypothetical protein